MENGLQQFIIQNIDLVKTLIYSMFGVLLSVIGIGFIGVIRLSYKIYSQQNDYNKKRFEKGDSEFKNLTAGQKGIKEEIKEGRDEAQAQREEIKKSISGVSDRLLTLETKHDNNHKDD